MAKELFGYDKFWVIWASCLDKPRTVKEVQRAWGYGGNSLYQKGQEVNIWKEMADKGYLLRQGRVKKRGVSGVLLYSRLEWVPEYLKASLSEQKFRFNNAVPYDVFECFDPQELVAFLDKERSSFFLLGNLKTLFGTKEWLRGYREMCLLAPLKAIVDIYLISFLKEQLSLDRDTFFLATVPVVFGIGCVDYGEYFLKVAKVVKSNGLPEKLFSRKKLMAIWKENTGKMFDSF